MEQARLDDNTFLKNLFDAFPSILFVVDADVRIVFWNAAAAQLIGTDKKQIYQRRGGEVLHCIHSTDVPEGCGRAEFCKDCVVRNAVNEAMQGTTVFRKKNRMELRAKGKVLEIHALVTTAPFRYEDKTFVLLSLEDISELIQLRSMLPICSSCKKIRNDKDYWESVDMYFNTHLDIEFTHSICPDCRMKMYPETIKKA
jgi:PAS domain S-box-containing protein